jgi:hypothetical protein
VFQRRILVDHEGEGLLGHEGRGNKS